MLVMTEKEKLIQLEKEKHGKSALKPNSTPWGICYSQYIKYFLITIKNGKGKRVICYS